MSSKIFDAVPVLDGANWIEWSTKMESFLLSTGQWANITGTAPTVPTVPALAAGGTNADAVEAAQRRADRAQDKLDDWNENDGKARGNMRLRLSPAIVNLVKGKTTAKEVWEALRDAHQQATLGNAYIEFKSMLDARIPDDKSPADVLAKIQAHDDRLNEMNVGLSD